MKLRQPHRAATDGHTLLPATHTTKQHVLVALGTLPIKTFLRWTFGRSTVIWRIWPAVLFHTAFAALVVSISLSTRVKLGVPNVLLTLLGVVIGFVISYRTASGYDRYWQGRSAWSDVMRTSRTFGRLVWYHVPLRMGPPAKRDDSGKELAANGVKGKENESREAHRLMAEKKMALELLEGFTIALKHHLRGETGIYYEDLYALVKPLHYHPPKHRPEPTELLVEEPETGIPGRETLEELLCDTPINPYIPAINAYGGGSSRIRPGHAHQDSLTSISSDSTLPDERRPLLPSTNRRHHGLLSGVAGDLIPFSGVITNVVKWFGPKDKKITDEERGVAIRDGERQRWTHFKHRPKVAGSGDNAPLQVIRCMTSWLSVLEERTSVPGTTLGGMFNCLNQFEDSLAVLEKILTTPLPFVFSVHIRHTIWLYLAALPFQLVDLFGWYTIPGVSIAAFIYLGFIATGEEIEQPFGYDENDLDLDMFCNEVVRNDIEYLRHTPCRNAYLISHHEGEDPVAEDFDPIGEHGRIEEVFGYHERQNL